MAEQEDQVTTTTTAAATSGSSQFATAAAQTPQQEFDALVARKEALWAQISGNTLYELTTEWKEIQSLDERMLALWNTGTVNRKEDK